MNFNLWAPSHGKKLFHEFQLKYEKQKPQQHDRWILQLQIIILVLNNSTQEDETQMANCIENKMPRKG